LVLKCYGEIVFRFFAAGSCKGPVVKGWNFALPAKLLGEQKCSFVRVNRFWCVWTRVLDFVLLHENWPGFLAMGCLTQSWFNRRL
jgi:hypothetical protein